MLKLNDINLNLDPDLIQPPEVEDNIVVIRLVADAKDIISSDIIDVALSYSISGIHVVLEIPFAERNKLDIKKLASLVCNGGWSLSLLPPKAYQKIREKDYYDYIVKWYQLWRSETMINFEGQIYPITPYLEYLTINHLVKEYKFKGAEKEKIIQTSQNPTDPYILDFINNVGRFVEFKDFLEKFIKKHDNSFYENISSLVEERSAIVISTT